MIPIFYSGSKKRWSFYTVATTGSASCSVRYEALFNTEKQEKITASSFPLPESPQVSSDVYDNLRLYFLKLSKLNESMSS